jgi:hypothetical protein
MFTLLVIRNSVKPIVADLVNTFPAFYNLKWLISCLREPAADPRPRLDELSPQFHTLYLYIANWIGHILRRNCVLKHVIEGKLEGRI